MLRLGMFVAALLAVASVAMAAPTLNVASMGLVNGYEYTTYDEVTGDPIVSFYNVLRIDVAVTTLDTFATTRIGGYGMALQLAGAGASHLTPLPGLMSRTVADWKADGLDFPFNVAGSLSDFDGNRLSFSYAVDNPGSATETKVIAANKKIASFFFQYDGVLAQGTTDAAARLAASVNLVWVGDGSLTSPWMQTQTVGGNATTFDVAFAPSGTLELPYTVVPEPATMGLLGLGLVGLISRRKK